MFDLSIVKAKKVPFVPDKAGNFNFHWFLKKSEAPQKNVIVYCLDPE